MVLQQTETNTLLYWESSRSHCHYNLSFPAFMGEGPSGFYVLCISTDQLPLTMVVLLIQLISVFAYGGNSPFSWDSSQSSHSESRLTSSLGHHQESRNLKQLICLLKPRTAGWYLDGLRRGPITWIKRSALSKKCKQAITTEPFLPYKAQVQIQV